MFRHSLLEETTKQIQELRARKAQLLQEVGEVEKELGEVQVKHARLVNECAALSKLPHELLADIFHKCQEIWLTTSSKHPFEVVACCVSSHWRETALGTPLLWNNIDLHITSRNNGKHHAQRLMAYLTRSGTCLLDISLRIVAPQNISQFLCLLVPHASRWHRVSISLSHCSTNDVYAPLYDVAAPALIHLSLRVGNPTDDPHSPRTEYPYISPPILTGGSPSLSFVRLAGMVVGNMEPPFGTVTTLHIDAWPRNLMDQSRFQAMFEALPCLVNLSLTGLTIYLPRDPLHVSSPTPIPTLRSLRIRGSSTPCHRFLSLMAVPHLESLSLHSVDTFDSVPLPTLRSLTLDSCVLSESEIRNILRAFPGVSTFSVDHSVPQAFLFHNMVTEGLWPCLEAISVRELQPDDAASFCLLSMSRSGDRGRLRRVRIDKRSRKVLKAKGYLQDLRDIVSVENCEHMDSWPSALGYEDPDDDWDY
jgi:F-box-like